MKRGDIPVTRLFAREGPGLGEIIAQSLRLFVKRELAAAPPAPPAHS